MIDTQVGPTPPAGPALPAGTVRLRRTAHGIELYFPPLRAPQAALPLAAFGLIAFALSAVGFAVMLPGVLENAAGVLGAVLMAGFVAPLAAFGAIFMGLAVYMLCNALLVRVEPDAIVTSRRIFGLDVRSRRLGRDALAAIETEIAARHQSVFSAEPVYQLVARDAPRSTRLVVAESLRGQALMEQVKALIESVLVPVPENPTLPTGGQA